MRRRQGVRAHRGAGRRRCPRMGWPPAPPSPRPTRRRPAAAATRHCASRGRLGQTPRPPRCAPRSPCLPLYAHTHTLVAKIQGLNEGVHAWAACGHRQTSHARPCLHAHVDMVGRMCCGCRACLRTDGMWSHAAACCTDRTEALHRDTDRGLYFECSASACDTLHRCLISHKCSGIRMSQVLGCIVLGKGLQCWQVSWSAAKPHLLAPP